MLLSCIFSATAQQSPPQQSPSQPPQSGLTGCVNRSPDGTLQLGLRSGALYRLQGRTTLLEKHVNQIVRVFGQPQKAAEGTPVLVVNGVQAIAGTCTAALPGKNPEPVEGKVGEDELAFPVSTTAAADETTPGFQTESSLAQSPGGKNVPATQSRHLARSPYAPAAPDQVAESESAANVNAEAASRAEILPGNTLGVGASAANAAPAGATQNASRAATVDITGNGSVQLSPARLNIRAGQTVQWRNSSGQVREIIANPAKSKPPGNALLPAGVNPFDSGFLRPNATFSYRFTVPGVYRYFCDLNSSQQVVGEVIVGR